jgi:pyrroloquinoline quinone biosynthesis protein B
MKSLCVLLFTVLLISCNETTKIKVHISEGTKDTLKQFNTSLVVLGTIQDGGSPHAGCKKNCCKDLFLNPDKNRMVVSLGIIDNQNKKNYLFEATPDISRQMKHLKNQSPFSDKETPDGIFVTHAHIGHYAGLMYLGKEAMNAKEIPVYVMPRLKTFLEQNGPWSQLVSAKNISLIELKNNAEISLTSNLKVAAITVPHRDEFSETVGFIISGPNKKVLFIPDIDKWNKWNLKIIEMISKVDYAFIDGTFYNDKEIDNRNISEIPHPFITESLDLFNNLPANEKNKIYFIHFNHTNALINKKSKESETVLQNGFHIAEINQVLEL